MRISDPTPPSKKKNHEAVLHHIVQAIRQCKEDSSLEQAKRHLYTALQLVEKVGDKREKNYSQALNYYNAAKENNKNWMELINQGLKKLVEDDEERID